MTEIGKELSAREVARRLHRRPETVTEWVRAGLIPTAYVSDGGRYYIQEWGVIEFLKERGQQ